MPAFTNREKRVGLHLPVRVTGTNAHGSPFEEATRSLNVSGGGLCFESRQQLSVGGRIRLEIDLPPGLRRHFGGKPLYAAAAVICRVEHFEDQPVFRVGARFLAEPDSRV